MNYISQFVKKMFAIEFAAVLGLLFAGWVLAVAQNQTHYETFFTYKIRHCDDVPAWFVATLALLAINGFWLFKLAIIDGSFSTPIGGPWGQWSLAVPVNHLRVFAVNLIAIPGLLLVFVVVRSSYW